MSLADAARGVIEIGKPFASALHLNLAAAVRTRRRGYSGWIGAVNTDYDPLDPATAAQPFDAYRALHRGGRVHYNPKRSTWILHRLDDVRAALRDTDQVTSTEGVTRIKLKAPVVALTDDEEHASLRRQAMPGFTTGAMESWQGKIEELAAELVADVIANPGCDVVERLSVPLPLRAIAHILGIPDRDIDDFHRWSKAGVRIIEFSPSPSGIPETARAIASVMALRRYFLRQFAGGGLKDSDTVLGRLLNHNTEGSLSDEQLFLIAMLLLIAGNETTTNLLSGMFDTLASNPDQYDLIRSNPYLIPIAVEEQLRFTSPIQNTFRYTRADYQIGEVTIPRGSRVLLSFAAANRDPLAYEEPDEYRVTRNPRTHVGFGYGTHMCLGAPLARLEAQAVLRELVDRVSEISAAGETIWSTHVSLRGPTYLPICLTPA
jgi:cytochrome P450